MTNEQMLNAMIPCALKRLEDAGSHEYIGATAMVSASDLRVLLAHVAALAAKDARIALAEGCLTRAGWEYIPDAIHGPVWKPPVNKAAADLRAAKAELATKDAEIAELKQRLADSMRDLQALKARPAPGEWIEWKGWRERHPIADGVKFRAEFVSGEVYENDVASDWNWGRVVRYVVL